MPERIKVVKAKLTNGTTIRIEATDLGGEANVAHTVPSFEGVTEAIEGIAASLKGTLEHVKPRKTTLELGLDVAVESGQLTALLVKGSGSANLKITLEWGES